MRTSLSENKITAGLILAVLFAFFGSVILSQPRTKSSSDGSSFQSGASLAQTNAAAPDATASLSLDDQERQIDKQHLRKIYDAIQAYKKKQGDLPP